jgi:UDP-N-acetyl-D-glucosamine dehydrogenase
MLQFAVDHLEKLDLKASTLAQKIQNKDSLIGIVGLGYVGLPIAFEFCQKGFQCIGIDVSQKVVDNLTQGINHIEDLDDDAVAGIVHNGLFRASTDYEELAAVDVIYICVPTPFNDNKDPDIVISWMLEKALPKYSLPAN